MANGPLTGEVADSLHDMSREAIGHQPSAIGYKLERAYSSVG